MSPLLSVLHIQESKLSFNKVIIDKRQTGKLSAQNPIKFGDKDTYIISNRQEIQAFNMNKRVSLISIYNKTFVDEHRGKLAIERDENSPNMENNQTSESRKRVVR